MKSSIEKILVISCIVIASLVIVSCGKEEAAAPASGSTVTILGSGSSN